jgi:Myb-like DNA-binding domain
MDHPPEDDDEVVVVSTTSQSPSSPPKEQDVRAHEASLAYYSYPSAPAYSSPAAVHPAHSYYYPTPLPYLATPSFPFAITYWYPTPPNVTPYYNSDGTPAIPAYYSPLPASAAAAPSIPTSCDDDVFHVSGTVQVPDKEDGAAAIIPSPTSELTAAPVLSKRAWLQKDDRKLRALVRRLGADKMEEVASKLSGWTADDCRSRWNFLARPPKPWTDDEDQRLRGLVPKYSSVDHNDEVAVDWMLVSKGIKSRLPTRCQERWEELHAEGIEPIPQSVQSASGQNSNTRHVKKEKRGQENEVAGERRRGDSVGSQARGRVPQSQIAAIQAIVTGTLRSNSASRKRRARADDGEGIAIQRRSRRNSKQ